MFGGSRLGSDTQAKEDDNAEDEGETRFGDVAVVTGTRSCGVRDNDPEVSDAD